MPEESRPAQPRRGSEHPLAVERPARFVAVRSATVFLQAAPLRRSSRFGPAQRRIRSRFAIRERFPATSNPAISGMHRAKCLARVCRVVERTVARMRRSVAGCPVFVFEAAALQFETCLAGSTNPSAIGSPRVLGERADWWKRSPGSLLSWFVYFQAADTHVLAAHAESGSAAPPAYRISRRGKA